MNWTISGRRIVQGNELDNLGAACEAVGVDLGAFDRHILEWLAGWEASTVEVVCGLITRAAAAQDH